MGADQESALRIRSVNRTEQLGHGVVILVVGLGDPVGSLLETKVHENRGDVVGEHAVGLPDGLQGVSHDDVGEQRIRSAGTLARFEEPGQEPRIIEERIEPFVAQRMFGALVLGRAPARDQSKDQLCVVSP
jgi:hypothetical protein